MGTLRLIGAGVGRTGTHSLKLAIEQLTGGRCHHMMEVNAEQTPVWRDAFLGRDVDWHRLLDDYIAIVDWPGAAAWQELAGAFPDAPVLLSTRSSADAWYTSATNTIFPAMEKAFADRSPESEAGFLTAMMSRFSEQWRDPDACKAAYEAHNRAVRESIEPGRLFEYQPGDGWGPLCAALGAAEPDKPFPHTNSTSDFRARRKMDPTD